MTYKCFKIRSQESRLSCITTKAEKGLPTSDFGLPTSDFRLLTSGFELQTSYFKLQTSDLTKCELRISDLWPLRLKAEWLDLRTSHFPLSTSHFPLPTSDFRLPTSDFRLPTSDFQLPISHFWVLTSDFWLDSQFAGINAQIQSSVERTAVPFSPQKRTTKLALEKATKHKANPATDERFAWRTETMVLPDHLFNCLFKKLLAGKEIPAPVKRIEKH